MSLDLDLDRAQADRTQVAGSSADAGEDPPPFLGRWRNVYLLVLGELAATIALFQILSWWAS